MNNNSKTEAFKNLAAKFGRKPGSHLYPLFNYFFVPQTKSQLRAWKSSIRHGVHNQDLLLCVEDYELIRRFSPETSMELTKSKTMCRINLDTFVKDVSDFLEDK